MPWETLATVAGIMLVAVSAAITVRAITYGEEFSDEGIEVNPDAITRRLFVAFCVSVDAQTVLLKRATWYTLAGGGVIGLTFVWILLGKIF